MNTTVLSSPVNAASASFAVLTNRTTATSITPSTNTTTTVRSDFDLALIPRDRIFQRTLMPWSVHHNISTGKWIATLTRPDPSSADSIRRSYFGFTTEREARKFCRSYAPPKLRTGHCCQLCQKHLSTARHCRNCGVVACDACSTRWGARMMPKTYLASAAATQRVCRSCDWLGNAFCMALLQGRYQDGLTLFESGNVNLRSSFADIHHEAMFPIHCAVMGGSLELVQWLVDTHLVPISVLSDPRSGRMISLQTSASRTLLDVAMTGTRPKLDILGYLIRKGLSILDVKDPTLIPKTLETILKAGGPIQELFFTPMVEATTTSSRNHHLHHIPISATCNMIVDDEASSAALDENACCICYERAMDCVLTPCGHQVCCIECGSLLQTCPVCKSQCKLLRVFRQ